MGARVPQVYVRICTACLPYSFGGPTVRVASPSLRARAAGALTGVGATSLSATAATPLAAAAPALLPTLAGGTIPQRVPKLSNGCRGVELGKHSLEIVRHVEPVGLVFPSVMRRAGR